MKKRAFRGAFFAIWRDETPPKSRFEKENARFFQKGLAKAKKMCYNIGCKFCWCSTGVVQLIRNQQVESSNLSTSSKTRGDGLAPSPLVFALAGGDENSSRASARKARCKILTDGKACAHCVANEQNQTHLAPTKDRTSKGGSTGYVSA